MVSSVAERFEAAADEVADAVSGLPDGAIRDAVLVYLDAQESVRADLLAGKRPSTAQITDAERALLTACGQR